MVETIQQKKTSRIRGSECLIRCGKCCQSKTLMSDCGWKVKLIARIVYFWKRIDIKSTKCPHLRFRNDGKAVCRNYKGRPQFCRDYLCEKAKNS